MADRENVLFNDKHVLICIESHLSDPNYRSYLKELEFIKSNFCGVVLSELSTLNNCSSDVIIYMGGDIEWNCRFFDDDNKQVYIIKELSYNNHTSHKVITIGEVPINVHNIGVYFRNFFSQEKDHFDLINKAHTFQSLKESNKKGTAFRKGIYLSNVEEDLNESKFHLLRCSTNLNGPTDNFKTPDYEIINKINDVCQHFFEQKVEMNHVLAQIYQNVTRDDTKERKARIKEHSDKTKDMPRNGLICFCTFYKDYSNNKFNSDELQHIHHSDNNHHVDANSYDFHYNNSSVLMRLRFKLKDTVIDPSYKPQFDVTLYPNSVFMMSLNTNRLYTHEIVPSVLPIDKIPIRMGYVARCSKTKAVFKDGQTYIVEDYEDKCNYIKLERPSDNDIKELREIYLKENKSTEMITYGNIYFSMNNGDYEKPNI